MTELQIDSNMTQIQSLLGQIAKELSTVARDGYEADRTGARYYFKVTSSRGPEAMYCINIIRAHCSEDECIHRLVTHTNFTETIWYLEGLLSSFVIQRLTK